MCHGHVVQAKKFQNFKRWLGVARLTAREPQGECGPSLGSVCGGLAGAYSWGLPAAAQNMLCSL